MANQGVWINGRSSRRKSSVRRAGGSAAYLLNLVFPNLRH